MAIIVLNGAEGAEQSTLELSLGWRESLSLVCEGASEIRVRGVYGIELVHKLTDAQREQGEPAITIDADELARWARVVVLDVEVISTQIAHPRSAGERGDDWRPLASIRVEPWGSRQLTRLSIALLLATSVTWIGLGATAAGAHRAKVDALFALLAFSLAIATRIRRSTHQPIEAALVAAATIALSIASLRSSVIVYNPSDAFVRGDALVTHGASRWSASDWVDDRGVEDPVFRSPSCQPPNQRANTNWTDWVSDVRVVREPGRFVEVPRSAAMALGIDALLRCETTGTSERCCFDRGPEPWGPLLIERAFATTQRDVQVLSPSLRIDRAAKLQTLVGTYAVRLIEVADQSRRRWSEISVSIDGVTMQWSRPRRDGVSVMVVPDLQQELRDARLTGTIQFEGEARRATFSCAPRQYRLSIFDVEPRTIASVTVDGDRAYVDEDAGLVVACSDGAVTADQIHFELHSATIASFGGISAGPRTSSDRALIAQASALERAATSVVSCETAPEHRSGFEPTCRSVRSILRTLAPRSRPGSRSDDFSEVAEVALGPLVAPPVEQHVRWRFGAFDPRAWIERRVER